MAKPGRKKKAKTRKAVPVRVSSTSVERAPEDPHARTLRRVSAEPSPVLIVGVVVFVIAVSISGGRYVLNPNLLAEPWRHIVGVLAAVFTFLAMSTLTSMAYCFMFHRNTTVVRAFVATVGNFATIGAILGTLLGLRLAVQFGVELRQNRGDHEQPFMDYVSVAGSTATVITLMMIGCCWVRSWGVVQSTIWHNVGAADTHSRTVVAIRRWLPLVIITGANFVAIEAALAMLDIVVSR
jgi:hypothetical protein